MKKIAVYRRIESRDILNKCHQCGNYFVYEQEMVVSKRSRAKRYCLSCAKNLHLI